MPSHRALEGCTRIVCYGVTGSGKTTLAARLSELSGLPWVEADTLTWEPGWREVPLAEQRRRIAGVVAREAWILDTAYGKWSDLVLARAELVVALDYGRWLTLGRLLRRTGRRIVDRQEVCNGNTESLRIAFSRESIILWHLRSFARKRERIAAWDVDPAMPRVVRLRSPRETRRWLATLGSPPMTSGPGVSR